MLFVSKLNLYKMFGLCLLNVSHSDLAARMNETLRSFRWYQTALRFQSQTAAVDFLELSGVVWLS